jgi:hypothetical protein
MMRSRIIKGILLVFLFVKISFGEPLAEISYVANDLGSERWEYVYTVENIGLTQGIDEFTVWFGIGSYDNLIIKTLDPPASNWDEIVWQPDPFLGDDGGYDALATGLNIGVGESVTGFAVSFDWSGEGTPGSQYYEIINPATFETIESGYTVPEPGTILLLGLGAVLLKRKR